MNRETLLFEIGMEECPARFIDDALDDLARIVTGGLDEHRLAYEAVHRLGTPRRLTVAIEGVATKQSDHETQVRGPAAQIAYDDAGNPTQAALGFAKSQGLAVDALQTREVDGGTYVVAVKREPGRPAEDLLPAVLEKAIQDLRFPKSMRWGEGTLRFARPIRWLLALFGSTVLPVNIEGVAADRITWGHRTLADGPITLDHADNYGDILERDGRVLVDIQKRRALIQEQVRAAAATAGGRAADDDDLLNEVTHLVEWPTALAGHFRSEYLDLPGAILETTMIEHQKYFPVFSTDGTLLPVFVTVRNGDDRALDTVQAGNEKVLAARLEDARFFFEEDKKQPLIDKVQALQDVLFQEQLGSVKDKVERMRHVAAAADLDLSAEDKDRLDRAVLLAKTDLLTEVVHEFPELQGVMGRVYASIFGEEDAVAQAIGEHYMPRHAHDAVPQSAVGSWLSVLDKIDTITGCFGIGLVPTGSTDPYALRRQALGVIRIALEGRATVGLAELVRMAADQYSDRIQDADATTEAVLKFFADRLRHLLIDQGYRRDVVSAVIGRPIDDLQQAANLVRSLHEAAAGPLWDDAIAAYHRAANLAAKADAHAVDPELFEEEAESALWQAVQAVDARLTSTHGKEAAEALAHLATLKTPIDDFFAAVMVMVDDRAVRANRLSLLQSVVSCYHRVADFGQIQE